MDKLLHSRIVVVELLGDVLRPYVHLNLESAGAFTFDFRHEMVHDTWLPDAMQRKVPLSEPFKLQARCSHACGGRSPGPDLQSCTTHSRTL